MDKYHIRQLILEALLYYDPATVKIEELCAFPKIEMNPGLGPRVAGEVIELVAHGYVANFRPSRNPLFRLTAKGRDQINRETDLDEFIWGEFASKFQV